MTGLQNAAKQYSIKIILVFHAHATKTHLLKALERKKNKEGGKGSSRRLFFLHHKPPKENVCVFHLVIYFAL